jgi:mRNA interferase MazF
MTTPRPGEVYWVDLGIAGKVRPLMVVSREDPDATRALAICVPLTTQVKGGNYEVPLPRVRWLPGRYEGVANVQGMASVEFHRLQGKAGRFEPSVLASVRQAIGWMLEL